MLWVPSLLLIFNSACTHHLEPVRSTIFFVEELFSVGEAALDAAVAFGGVGAIEVGDVLVADVAEPVIMGKIVRV